MSGENSYLTVPDLVERLGLAPSRIRRLIDELYLPATRRDGVLVVPEEFLDGNEIRHDLHGTALVLQDGGYSPDEIVEWLTTEEPTLGARPIDVLILGRKAEVRRIAQALA